MSTSVSVRTSSAIVSSFLIASRAIDPYLPDSHPTCVRQARVSMQCLKLRSASQYKYSLVFQLVGTAEVPFAETSSAD